MSSGGLQDCGRSTQITYNCHFNKTSTVTRRGSPSILSKMKFLYMITLVAGVSAIAIEPRHHQGKGKGGKGKAGGAAAGGAAAGGGLAALLGGAAGAGAGAGAAGGAAGGDAAAQGGNAGGAGGLAALLGGAAGAN
ncbi:hypothetical protein N8I77_007699 [Diaporthe amygdali]|uniref:Uncharacterized protein n=1 Tax=Phomopsis amygdali TaxID=1214568 RepID=A0AAD9SBR2_PHOAM|nr:hypothetical protein N8I77_007699 [Diaporthe amygdali]